MWFICGSAHMTAILSFLSDIFYHFTTDVPNTEDGENVWNFLQKRWWTVGTNVCVECKRSTKTCLLWLSCHFTAMPTLNLLLAIAAVTILLCSLQKHFYVLPSNVFHFHMLLTVLNSENFYDHKHPSFLGCSTVLTGKHLLTFQTNVPPSKYLELFTSQQGIETHKTWTFYNTSVTSLNLTHLSYVFTLYHTAGTLPITLQLFLNWPIPYLHQHCL
jgi:hypothetical protein